MTPVPTGTGGLATTGGTASNGPGGMSTGGAPNAGATSSAGAPAGSGGSATGGVSATGGSGNAGGATGGKGGAGGTGGAGGVGTTTACVVPGKGAHYVDATAGDDAKDGRTADSAWKTLSRVNSETFQPGAAICLRAGGSWTGALAPKGSGTAAAPIVIDQYGTGNKPRIAAGASDQQPLLLENVQYWEVNNLELTNTKAAPGDYRGILVRGKDAGVLNHIHIRNSFIHDVNGQVNWIGGSTADDAPPWVKFQTGWDASKRTGGIVVEVQSANGTKTWFNDVVIENNVIQDTSFGGIVFKQLEGSYGWGVRSSGSDSKFVPHTNIVVRNNYLSQTNTKYGCNSIYMTGARHVLIERNVCKDSGTSAIEAYNADDVRIQYNETYGTVRKAGGADSNGIDADRATTNTIIQYNYVHNNGDGILICQFVFGDAVIRYNLVMNNSRHGINLHSDKAATNQIYNNLLMIDGINSGNLVATSGNADQLAATYALKNNIFHSTRSAASVVSGPGVSYGNNLFSGIATVGSAAQTGAPLFVDGSVRPNGTSAGPALSALQGLQLRAGSPAIDKGVAITNHGGVDFWGNSLYKGQPDIGPFELP